jgi:hypothetical protein
MIARFVAHKYLLAWGEAESNEVRHIDFPKVSPMFRDHESGYRVTFSTADDELIPDRVGLVLQEMHPALGRTLRRYYFEGRDISKTRKAFDMAMSDFCRRWDSALHDSGDHVALG